MEIPLTRMTLQTGVQHNADVDAWREFVRFYCPVIYGFARKRGFQDADAARLMRTVLQSVARSDEALENSPRSGTVVGRLYSVTCNVLSTYQNRTSKTSDRNSEVKGSQVKISADREVEPDSDWDLAYQRRLVMKAMDGVKSEFDQLTWQAFWRTIVDGQPSHDAGLELNMTPGAVCIAKCRVLSRLSKEMQPKEVQ